LHCMVPCHPTFTCAPKAVLVGTSVFIKHTFFRAKNGFAAGYSRFLCKRYPIGAISSLVSSPWSGQ
jgi:hypothetical protein